MKGLLIFIGLVAAAAGGAILENKEKIIDRIKAINDKAKTDAEKLVNEAKAKAGEAVDAAKDAAGEAANAVKEKGAEAAQAVADELKQ